MTQSFLTYLIMNLSMTKGEIAPWFDQPGGGIQYKLEPLFEEEIRVEMRKNGETQIIRALMDQGYLGLK